MAISPLGAGGGGSISPNLLALLKQGAQNAGGGNPVPAMQQALAAQPGMGQSSPLGMGGQGLDGFSPATAPYNPLGGTGGLNGMGPQSGMGSQNGMPAGMPGQSGMMGNPGIPGGGQAGLPGQFDLSSLQAVSPQLVQTATMQQKIHQVQQQFGTWSACEKANNEIIMGIISKI